MENESKQAVQEDVPNSEETLEEQKASAEKAINLLAGTESNLVALHTHYLYLENFAKKYLQKIEETKNVAFDDYIADLLVVDLFVHDMATYIGHFKIFGAKVITKITKEETTEQEKDKAMLKLLRFEQELPKMKDEEYYEVIIDKQVEVLIEKSKEEGFEGIVQIKNLENNETE